MDVKPCISLNGHGLGEIHEHMNMGTIAVQSTLHVKYKNLRRFVIV